MVLRVSYYYNKKKKKGYETMIKQYDLFVTYYSDYLVTKL